jgi:hypothetical protein
VSRRAARVVDVFSERETLASARRMGVIDSRDAYGHARCPRRVLSLLQTDADTTTRRAIPTQRVHKAVNAPAFPTPLTPPTPNLSFSIKQVRKRFPRSAPPPSKRNALVMFLANALVGVSMAFAGVS